MKFYQHRLTGAYLYQPVSCGADNLMYVSWFLIQQVPFIGVVYSYWTEDFPRAFYVHTFILALRL